MNALLEVAGLRVHFPLPRRLPWQARRKVHAVDGIDFTLAAGRTLGIVGESGSGKTTAALAVMRLADITAGEVRLKGTDITHLAGEELRTQRRYVQMIFQDPYSSLNPRSRASAIVEEPLARMGIGDAAERRERARELFAQVGLRPDQLALFPHQFSGGQRQRIGIARALATRPELIVCDEPVSALDVAIQAQILNLLARLQNQHSLSYLFISHDLGVVQHLCDEVAVMYLGRIVEQAPRARLFADPLHPYTWALFSAVPRIGRRRGKGQQRLRLEGDPPSPIDLPRGCRFAGRCPFAE
ncbi:MAG: ABC transporter ATP-binding protein, partial [Betaproteobacteria bacterium]|nr:ABC transporter ATP-binding protein [Betaproteobacteria bacterium]